MISALDMGNTSIMTDDIDDEQTYSVECATADLIKTSLGYAVSIRNILEIRHIDAPETEGIIISSVIPPFNATLSSVIKEVLGFRPRLVSSDMKTGLNIHMDSPKTVGSGLIVDAVAAIKEYPCLLIVIDMDTATTIYVVGAGSSYIGGIIYSGPKILLETLSSHIAQLPNISLDIPLRVIGRNTIDCMCSGVMYDNASVLGSIIGRMEQELGAKTTILVADGLSCLIAPLYRHTIMYEGDLMLEELLILYNKNKQTPKTGNEN